MNTNSYNNQMSSQPIQHIPQQNPMTAGAAQYPNTVFNDRRPSYPPAYQPTGYPFPVPNPLLPHNPLMNPMMNPLMNAMASQMNPLPQMYATNPLHNMYAFNNGMNGSQTSLDRFGYPVSTGGSSVATDQSYINSLLPNMSSRYSSCENLQSISSSVTNRSNMESGLQLIQLLRDADRKGYTADDVEVAINFSAEKPLEWLDENWHNMCETVMTLTNNQIMQNETKSGNKRLMDWDLLTEAEAKVALRGTKGNIWQSIEKCVKNKQNTAKTGGTGNGVPDGDHKTSLSLEISGMGSGKDNNDSNVVKIVAQLDQINDSSDAKPDQYIEERVITEELTTTSDFDDEPEEENFYSASDNDSTGDDEDSAGDDPSSPAGKWSCRSVYQCLIFCTFINDNKCAICEMCSKTRHKNCIKKPSNRKNRPQNRTRRLSSNGSKASNKDTELDFDEKIVNEQKAIEKELIRRLENERRIDRQNEKISRREEFIRRKSLGLPVSEQLADQIRADQTSAPDGHHINDDNNDVNKSVGNTDQNPMTAGAAQYPNTVFNDRRPSYPPAYQPTGYPFPVPNPLLPHNPLMNPMMNPLMNAMASQMNPLPQMYATNPLHNMYAFNNGMNGSQTSLDRFGYPVSTGGSSVATDHSYINPLLPNMSSRYSSCENLQSISSSVTNRSNMESGLQLIQLLRDADRKGYTADDVEVAINFSADKPLEWLDENWHNMCETVMTLTNNQIMQNETKSGNKRLMDWDLLTEAEAKVALRGTKGNIWQSIEKCVKNKQNTAKMGGTGNGVPDGDHKTSLSLEISGMGSGKENNDSNVVKTVAQLDQINDSSDAKPDQYIEERVITEELTTTVTTNLVHQEIAMATSSGGMSADRKVLSNSMEQLLSEWKIEKQLSDRQRLQEREREKMRKILELQKRLSEFDTDLDDSSVSTTADEVEDLPLDTGLVVPAADDQPFTDVTGDELQLIGIEVRPMDVRRLEISGHESDGEDPLEDVASDGSVGDELDLNRDPNEYYSDGERADRLSDDFSDDEFARIDARIQQKLDQNFAANRVAESVDIFNGITGDKNSIQENPIYTQLSDNKSVENTIEKSIEPIVEQNVVKECDTRDEFEYWQSCSTSQANDTKHDDNSDGNNTNTSPENVKQKEYCVDNNAKAIAVNNIKEFVTGKMAKLGISNEKLQEYSLMSGIENKLNTNPKPSEQNLQQFVKQEITDSAKETILANKMQNKHKKW
ncbi:unnamed protein product [Medioppia subpectinata]|uniref:E3 ubiquitin-protein ligase RNF31 UBA-like domain-containing protein n=1 Tax=Medioppia subpectinata TaxID=1979941 RepID=A0A7R9KVE7_9ACAR|nr:unnamed protein product [Medioppia subpectinata]CAG2109451.1 unnamed protein product [Medioppia subpectinata]